MIQIIEKLAQARRALRFWRVFGFFAPVLTHTKEPIAIFYLHPITQGEYSLYQIRHHGEFAIAGLRRTDNGPWEIDQIKGAKNAEPSERVREHFLHWHAMVNHELGA